MVRAAPFEYSFVSPDETAFGIFQIMNKELNELDRKGIPRKRYEDVINGQIEETPDSPLPYVKKSLFFQRQNLPKSKDALDRGFEEIGDNHLLYHCRGMIRELEGDREGAIADMKSAIELYPIAIETLYTIGTLLNRSERHEEAIEYWDRILEITPEDCAAWNGKAKSEYALGDNERALKHMTAAIYCSPKTWHFHSNKGQLLLEMDRIEEALEDFERAVELTEDPSRIVKDMKEKTRRYPESGRYDDMAQVLEKALEFDPDNLDTLFGLLATYNSLNHQSDAEKTVDSIYDLTRSFTDVETLELVSSILFGHGRTKEAEEITGRLYSITGNKRYLMNLAALNIELGDGPFGREREPESPLTIRKKNRVGRNDPCPCGSGTKFKKCHGN